jgi:hypothetical protein
MPACAAAGIHISAVVAATVSAASSQRRVRRVMGDPFVEMM